MQQCGMIALKSMLAERTHVFFHTSKYMRKNLVCVGNSHCPVQPVTTSHVCINCIPKVNSGQSWSETVCSKCSHPCRTTRYNDGKHKVATHSAYTTNTPPPSRSGMQRTSNRVATITSQSTTDDLQQKREKTRDKCSAWSSSKCTNQYKHGCEVQLNIPEKQLRLWTECKSSSGNRD